MRRRDLLKFIAGSSGLLCLNRLAAAELELIDESLNIEGDTLKADTLIVNSIDPDIVFNSPSGRPYFFAIAIKYDENVSTAPVVTAKGFEISASNMIKIARKNKIPVILHPPLARFLYTNADVDKLIPKEIFVEAAKVLTFVYENPHVYTKKWI